ncbi:MAG: glutamine synthetase [Proteobacteria bacterium]|nr:glutamine synthetase [Pseudomonadota bacterium]
MPKNGENTEIEQWLNENNVQNVEVLVSDLAGIGRGKVMPAEKFIKAHGTRGLRVPDSLFSMTVDCEFITNEYITAVEEDVHLVPDFATAGLVPWLESVTAFFICDVRKEDGTALGLSPRQVLKNILSLYAEKGWEPIVAPEFEFTLLARDTDAEGAAASPAPPRGKSGRLIVDRGVLSIDGITEFGPLFDDVRRYCNSMGLPVDALVQEAGVGQFEFNVAHGEPLRMADVAFQFKRIMKWAAVQHGLYASFMAKPYPGDFGNAMHIHQSVVDAETKLNIFADEDGNDTGLFTAHVAGLQKYAAAAMPFFAPYSNSYLRLSGHLSSPVNTHWGMENRSVGLRVPAGGGASRRIENRIAGSDTNPYLAIAASLLCGYLGMVEGLKPTPPVTGSAYDLTTNGLPQHIHASLEALERCDPLREFLGEGFVTTFLDVKKAEIKARSNVLSPWDTKFLLTNV